MPKKKDGMSIRDKVRAGSGGVKAPTSVAKRASMITLICTVISIMSISIGLLTFIRGRQYSEQTLSATEEVVVPTANVDRGKIFSADMVTLKRVPKAFLPANYYTDTKEVINKVASTQCFTNVPIDATNLSDVSGTGDLAKAIGPNSLAITLPIPSTDAGLVNMLKVGDYVNILGNVGSGQWQMVMTNRRIVALDNYVDSTPGSYSYITFEVPANDQTYRDVLTLANLSSYRLLLVSAAQNDPNVDRDRVAELYRAIEEESAKQDQEPSPSPEPEPKAEE